MNEEAVESPTELKPPKKVSAELRLELEAYSSEWTTGRLNAALRKALEAAIEEIGHDIPDVIYTCQHLSIRRKKHVRVRIAARRRRHRSLTTDPPTPGTLQ